MMKKITKFVTLLLALAMVFSLAACSSGKDKDKADGSADIAALIATEPSSADEAAKLYQQLMQKENDILAANSELWNKVFLSANKNNPMIEDGTNYGDFLLATIESAKDSFSADELKTLKAGAEQIKEIEGKLTILEQKYPGCGTAPGAGDSVSAEEAGMTASGSNAMKFPSFQGKDLDGNDVDSSKLFAGNSVTVVNFWFTTCNPCVGELADLEALNKDLAAKGGAVVGINSFTLDGDKTAIAEAKDILAKKGVTYSNLWFASDSEAGKFTAGLYSFPTTYVVDKNGNIVGQPIVGAITAPDQAKKLNELIEKAEQSYCDYEFHIITHAVNDFCVTTLSSFYLDIVKDRLYCDGADSLSRRSAQTALYLTLHTLSKLFAPILAFTCDEIWLAMPHTGDDDARNVVLNEMNKPFTAYALDSETMARWEHIIAVRTVVNGALEEARAAKVIGKSLEADVHLTVPESDRFFADESPEALADIFIVSKVELAIGDALAVKVDNAAGTKCPRCWKHSLEANAEGLCPRCAEVVKHLHLTELL